MEGRTSTRLGENVKVLAYVSIFYLPLAFCAAIWAVPNLSEKATRSAFIMGTCVTATLTYLAVFNMQFITTKLERLYTPYREKVVKQMQEEEYRWKDLGQRFEQFKPATDTRVPTEWWILAYSARNFSLGIMRLLQKIWQRQAAEATGRAPEESSAVLTSTRFFSKAYRTLRKRCRIKKGEGAVTAEGDGASRATTVHEVLEKV